MVSLDDVWRPIACPWISPYHCHSGIVLDVKIETHPKRVRGPTALVSMFTGPMQLRSDVRWGQRHTNNRSSSEQTSFMQSARRTLTGQRAVAPAVSLLVSSGVWHIATGSDRLPL
ncbi:hypothetical protein AVEN_238389-1 [Araneus ventricosus]|uniref:Uncharacterized protein n=1 Tax=Araneus ventricosus TaxID=182803 RepID=A0A4Y2DMD1_ARAVE|nr:hypothetical protein AVEN_238389-1 [Araneus ventricosus]